MIRTLVLLAAATSQTACNMAPTYVRSVSEAVPPSWPSGASYAPAQASGAGMAWRTLATDPKLQAVIERALAHNQDLSAAVANVASARAQYRVQRSYQAPTVAADAGAAVTRTLSGAGNGAAASSTLYSGSVGVSGFELDLFGRLKNLSQASFEQYLATQSGARSTRFAIVAETATAYATLAADQDLLAVAKAQVASGERTVKLTQQLHDVGLVTGSDVADAGTVLAQARSDVESYTTQVAQDRNALELLVGAPVEDALLPASLDALDPGIGTVPAGLSSAVLLDRPDVVEAEHQLKGAYADIGAAKAAFFPTISLTSALGLATTALSGLFGGATSTWSATPSIGLPLLGGANRGNLDYARAQADYDLATYRKAAQTAYRDVADGLARRGTIDRQRAAQVDLVTAASRSYAIAEARYRQGSDSFLTALVAQRTLYAARQSAIAVQLADLTNRVTLYQAIGSDDTL
jgi:multidrug efflux system outer membrane protein